MSPPLRVLIVDDNQDLTAMVALGFERFGHVVAIAGDGEDALATVDLFAPSVVFLDIGLPGMDGFEVARRLRAKGNTARLVAMSGYGQPSDLEATRDAGFDRHVVKPDGSENAARRPGWLGWQYLRGVRDHR